MIRVSVAVFMFLNLACASTKSRPTPRVERAHAAINGIQIYYEVHGQLDGVPLVLLHGGGSTIDVTFGQILPWLAQEFRVIAIEEQGHGRTSDRHGPVRFETSADDVAALLRFLQVERADLLGFSNGASVALQVALRHPTLVRKLVFASSMTKKSGAQPQLWEFMKKADVSTMPQGLKDAFLKVNPDPARLKLMHDKDRDRMLAFKDVDDNALKTLRASTLVMIGDQDIVRPEHALHLVRTIPRARLMIVPGNHGSYLGELVMSSNADARAPEITAQWVSEFLRSDAF